MTLERIYELHADFVFRSLRRLGVPDHDAGDALQEVFLTVHRTLSTFEGRCSMATWLFTICRSVARDRRRRAYRRYEVVAGPLVDAEPDLRSDLSMRLEHRQKLAELDTILDTMEEEQRLVFVLFEIESLTGEEISEALEILPEIYSHPPARDISAPRSPDGAAEKFPLRVGQTMTDPKRLDQGGGGIERALLRPRGHAFERPS
jgi:RNA polymerase sigma-70 factor (ECF subfamily)